MLLSFINSFLLIHFLLQSSGYTQMQTANGVTSGARDFRDLLAPQCQFLCRSINDM